MQILNIKGRKKIMHELSYVLDIIDSVQSVKEKEGFSKVNKIIVNVGQMSGVVPFYLNKYFEEAKKGTFLADTILETVEKEVIIKCEGCNKEYTPRKETRYKCPFCGERKGKLIQGKGITIENIEVEDE